MESLCSDAGGLHALDDVKHLRLCWDKSSFSRLRLPTATMSSPAPFAKTDADVQEVKRHGGKLGTVPGVYIPVCLNILSILMFLRFGVILGRVGFVGIVGKVSFNICRFRIRMVINACTRSPRNRLQR